MKDLGLKSLFLFFFFRFIVYFLWSFDLAYSLRLDEGLFFSLELGPVAPRPKGIRAGLGIGAQNVETSSAQRYLTEECERKELSLGWSQANSQCRIYGPFMGLRIALRWIMANYKWICLVKLPSRAISVHAKVDSLDHRCFMGPWSTPKRQKVRQRLLFFVPPIPNFLQGQNCFGSHWSSRKPSAAKRRHGCCV